MCETLSVEHWTIKPTLFIDDLNKLLVITTLYENISEKISKDLHQNLEAHQWLSTKAKVSYIELSFIVISHSYHFNNEIKFHEDVNYMNRNTVLSIYNPLTPKIFSVILLTVHYKILLMLLLRIWYWINY